MNMKMFYDWLSEIKSIEKSVLVSIGIADACYKALELRVDFINSQGKKYGCIEIINIEGENDLFNRNLFIALNKIKLFIRSQCLFNKK